MKYTISARELTGTSAEVAEQIDDLVVALLAVRNTLAQEPEAARHGLAAQARAAMLLLSLAAGAVAAAVVVSGMLA